DSLVGETTMQVRTQLRTLALASLLALTILSLPGVQAYAMPIQEARRQECLAKGFAWSDKLGCANKGCSLWDGKSEPGDTVFTSDGSHAWMCNGWTGKWDQVYIRPGASISIPTQPLTVQTH